MIKTRSNEMKIECEKGYVWCLVGMSMRSAIWNQFWGPKWSQNGTQSAPKSVPKRLWKAIAIRRSKKKARSSPGELRRSCGGASPQFDPAIFGPQIGPKIVQEAFKNRFGKRLQNNLAFETDLGPIFN